MKMSFSVLLFFPFISHAIEKVQYVGAGYGYTCVVTEKSTVDCWGLKDDGRTSPPSDLQHASELSVNAHHSCAIQNKIPFCWGSDDFGKVKIPEDIQQVDHIFTGLRNTCILQNGKPHCWGEDQYGKNQVPAELQEITQLAIGKLSICALDKNGRVSCWGYNKDNFGTPPSDLGKVTKITAGFLHFCAINDKKTTKCWGSSSYDKTKTPTEYFQIIDVEAAWNGTAYIDGSTVQVIGGRYVPPGLIDPTQVALGYNHVCVNSPEGVQCWGKNEFGQLNVPEKYFESRSQVGAENVTDFIGCYGTADGRFDIKDYNSPKRVDEKGLPIPSIFIAADTALGYIGWAFGLTDIVKSYHKNSIYIEFAKPWFESDGTKHDKEITRARLWKNPDGSLSISAWWLPHGGPSGNGFVEKNLPKRACP